LIDPEKIEDILLAEVYSGLAKALTEMTPDQVINEVKNPD